MVTCKVAWEEAKVGKKVYRYFLRFVITVFTIASLLLLAWGWDVHSDRKHTVTVIAKTRVFAGIAWCAGDKQFLDVSPGTHLKVRRIRYWKDCATVNVALPDGREGFIIYDGSVSVKPPL